jgi:hypothetical protein
MVSCYDTLTNIERRTDGLAAIYIVSVIDLILLHNKIGRRLMLYTLTLQVAINFSSSLDRFQQNVFNPGATSNSGLHLVGTRTLLYRTSITNTKY